jgi:hypothetical protein
MLSGAISSLRGGGTYNNHDGFKFGQTTYIGFKFLISGQAHYGWARVVVRFDPDTRKRKLYLQVTGYAYEATPNKTIKAGADFRDGRGQAFGAAGDCT